MANGKLHSGAEERRSEEVGRSVGWLRSLVGRAVGYGRLAARLIIIFVYGAD